jgi:hypothetical protein
VGKLLFSLDTILDTAAMPPLQQLPVHPRFASNTPDEYVTSLLEFWSDPLLQTLCGGVHILDFFTRDSETGPPDIYRTVLPADWIVYFESQSIGAVLDLLLRTPLAEFTSNVPATLKTFIQGVREHSLQRGFARRDKSERTKKTTGYGTEWALNMGMKPKKIHEVCDCLLYNSQKIYIYTTVSHLWCLRRACRSRISLHFWTSS